jgi:hypothetical protein
MVFNMVFLLENPEAGLIARPRVHLRWGSAASGGMRDRRNVAFRQREQFGPARILMLRITVAATIRQWRQDPDNAGASATCVCITRALVVARRAGSRTDLQRAAVASPHTGV